MNGCRDEVGGQGFGERAREEVTMMTIWGHWMVVKANSPLALENVASFYFLRESLLFKIVEERIINKDALEMHLLRYL